MAQNTLTKSFEDLSKIVKLILIFFFGGLISPIYRIIRYTETKNTVTLIIGVLSLLTYGFFGILILIDFITEITSNRITVLAD